MKVDEQTLRAFESRFERFMILCVGKMLHTQERKFCLYFSSVEIKKKLLRKLTEQNQGLGVCIEDI